MSETEASVYLAVGFIVALSAFLLYGWLTTAAAVGGIAITAIAVLRLLPEPPQRD
jgi:hypothetical protein